MLLPSAGWLEHGPFLTRQGAANPLRRAPLPGPSPQNTVCLLLGQLGGTLPQSLHSSADSRVGTRETTERGIPQWWPAQGHPKAIDPLYLFACQVEWEKACEPSSAWELIAAAQSTHEETRAHARALLASSLCSAEIDPNAVSDSIYDVLPKSPSVVEVSMKPLYGLEVNESCEDCPCRLTGFFNDISPDTVAALDQVSRRSTVPAGAILFVAGQMPRGLFVLCSGQAKLSTSSREGKVLILKTSEAGEAIGLSAAISGQTYEVTAETTMPSQLNFVNRKDLLNLLQNHGEVRLRAVQCLSGDFQAAYRGIHDMFLARSAAGKLAKLLLANSLEEGPYPIDLRLKAGMTHEEMSQRIGSTRETVTRLLSDLKKNDIIRLDGTTLVIRNRTALVALTV
jgi:CRP/FNR family transcriptional regulator, cyclic AMP receptor protein